jgi:hypothetical protein
MVMEKTLMLCVVSVAALALSAGPVKAEMFDLTGSGSGTAEINGALFYNSVMGSGTGYIQPFLRIQKKGVEQGYNTDYRPAQYPEMTDPWTQSLLLSAVPTVQLDDEAWYREFLLDLNQNNSAEGRFLSLDKLEIYLGGARNLTNHPTGLGTKIYDLDAAADNWIFLDATLSSGSGDSDMYAYIPNELFVGGAYVYLYSMFGVNNPANATFEEWAVRTSGISPGTPTAPVPQASFLACSV